MKKTTQSTRLLLALLLPLLLFAGCEKEPQGTGSGKFSVSKNRQVRFAHGNLAEDGRSFTAHQWEYGGYFGWGTGDNPGNNSQNDNSYSTFHDWGDYIEGNWRTLSKEEWQYIIHERTDAGNKYGNATVNDIHGLILLPDTWELPTGYSFIPGSHSWSENVYTDSQWQEMEKKGAVFLPASGYRNAGYNDCRYKGESGVYHSSTPTSPEWAGCLSFAENYCETFGTGKRTGQCSVRLAWDVN